MNTLITELTERLENGIHDVFSQKNFREYLRWQSSFYDYSFQNQLLIWMQTNGKATYVAGFKTWQKMGRFVKKGEKAIKIIIPLIRSKKRDDSDDGIYGFFAGNVFDIAQTDGKPAPEICNRKGGNFVNYVVLKQAIEDLSPNGISFVDVLPGEGSFNSQTKRIEIQNGMSQERTLNAMVHELAHSLMHGEGEKEKFSRADREMQAESVAYIVCTHFGIDIEQNSFEYVASWSTSQDARTLKENMFEISECGKRIINELEATLNGKRKENADD